MYNIDACPEVTERSPKLEKFDRLDFFVRCALENGNMTRKHLLLIIFRLLTLHII